jgi:hypothetical protein
VLTPIQGNHVIQRRGATAVGNADGGMDGAGPPPPPKLPSMSLDEIVKRAKRKAAWTTLPIISGNRDPPTNAATFPPANASTFPPANASTSPPANASTFPPANAGTLPESNTQPEPSTASTSASTESGQPQAVIIPVTGPNSLQTLVQQIIVGINSGGGRPIPDQLTSVPKYKPKSKAKSNLCKEKGTARETRARNHHLVSEY